MDRGQGRRFLKPPRAIRPGEDMGEYLLCERGFVPTITVAVEREMAARVRYHESLRVAEDTDFAIRLQLAGCAFKMAPEAGAVWKDLPDPGRTSAGGPASFLRAQRFAKWLALMKPQLTRRAWLGARGWAYAKMVARDGHKMKGAGLLSERRCSRAVTVRAWPPIIFLQIFLDARFYRALADQSISWLRLGLRKPARKPGALETGMIDRRAFLAGGASVLAAPAAGAGQPMRRPLRAIAAAKGLLFGSATATYELKDADFATALAREAAILVPEYEMKRNDVEAQPGVYDFAATDSLMDFARAHGMAMRGHPMVWYYANPPWLEQTVLSSTSEKPLTDYVTALARHYRGRMHSWDVVNEALAPDGSGWRDCFWLRRYGPAYVELAFHAARAADPGAMLVYNDFGCEQGAPANDRFRGQTLKLLDGLLKRGVPLDALGLQAHLSAFGAKVDPKKLRAFLAEIRARRLGGAGQ